MKAQGEVDVCIVGLGAVGAMAAHVLATAGLEVVALEAGPARTGREYQMDELASSAGRNAWGDTKFTVVDPSCCWPSLLRMRIGRPFFSADARSAGTDT